METVGHTLFRRIRGNSRQACRSRGRRLVGVLQKIGAGERTRTADLLITNQLLYQLSYAGREKRY